MGCDRSQINTTTSIPKLFEAMWLTQQIRTINYQAISSHYKHSNALSAVGYKCQYSISFIKSYHKCYLSQNLVVIETLSKHIGLWARLHEVCNYYSEKVMCLALFWALFTSDNISFSSDRLILSPIRLFLI